MVDHFFYPHIYTRAINTETYSGIPIKEVKFGIAYGTEQKFWLFDHTEIEFLYDYWKTRGYIVIGDQKIIIPSTDFTKIGMIRSPRKSIQLDFDEDLRSLLFELLNTSLKIRGWIESLDYPIQRMYDVKEQDIVLVANRFYDLARNSRNRSTFESLAVMKYIKGYVITLEQTVGELLAEIFGGRVCIREQSAKLLSTACYYLIKHFNYNLEFNPYEIQQGL